MSFVIREFFHDADIQIPAGVSHVTYQFVESVDAQYRFAGASTGSRPIFSAYLRPDGTLYTSGDYFLPDGVIGNGAQYGTSIPFMVGETRSFKRYAVGANMTGPATDYDSASVFAIERDNGRLWSWGTNESGQLGIGSLTQTLSPVANPLTLAVQDVSSNMAVTLILGTDGTLWSTGIGDQGTLGNNTLTSVSTPVQVVGDNQYLKAQTFYRTAVALDTKGRLWNWGLTAVNDMTATAGSSSPIQMINSKTFIDFAGGNSGTAGSNSGNEYIYVALADDRTVWTWGFGSSGQLGTNEVGARRSPSQVVFSDPTFIPKKIRNGGLIMGVLGEDGRVMTWGIGNAVGDGQTATSRSTPVFPSGGHVFQDLRLEEPRGIAAVALKTDGTLWYWGLRTGLTTTSVPTLLPTSSPARFISFNPARHSLFAINEDGSLWGCGLNSNGQLGTGAFGTVSPMQGLTNLNSNSWQGGDGTVRHTWGAANDVWGSTLEVPHGGLLSVRLGPNPSVNGAYIQPIVNLDAPGSNTHRPNFFARKCIIGWVE